jgi:hypothetical protein
MSHILEKYRKEEHFFPEPFPHIIIENCLDDDLYKLLAENFPRNDSFEPQEKEENQPYWIYGDDILKIAPVWSDFINDHISQEFFDAATKIIKPFMVDLDPNYMENLGSELEDCSFGLAGSGRENNLRNMETNIAISVAVGINTPCTKRSVIDPPHNDFPQKLFNSLLYMRSDEDESEGGDLTLYRTEDGFLFNNRVDRFNVDEKYLTPIKTVKYSKNLLILFPQKLNAVHGVTARGPTPHTRRYININMESFALKEGAFFKVPRSFYAKAKITLLSTAAVQAARTKLRPFYHFVRGFYKRLQSDRARN